MWETRASKKQRLLLYIGIIPAQAAIMLILWQVMSIYPNSDWAWLIVLTAIFLPIHFKMSDTAKRTKPIISFFINRLADFGISLVVFANVITIL